MHSGCPAAGKITKPAEKNFFEFLRGGDAEVLAVRNEGSVSGFSYYCFETYILLREMLSVSNHLL